MKQIFISYAPRDREYAHELRDELAKIGYSVWVNRDARTANQAWQYGVTDGIKSSDALVVILSPAAADNLYITYEWAFALGAGVKVLPIIFRGVNAHPHLMVQEQFDFGAYPERKQFWQQFLRELQRILGDVSQQQTKAISQSPVKTGNSGFYLVVEWEGKGKERHHLAAESISLGREDSNDICIPDSGVSRTHLRFVRTRNGYQVIDMGSTNGTFMGEDRIDMIELKPDDELRIGDRIKLRFEYVS